MQIKDNRNKLSNLVSILNMSRNWNYACPAGAIYNSKENLEVLDILEQLGYVEIQKTTREDMLNNVIRVIKIGDFKEISKKSRRIYRKKEDIEVDYKNGLGEYIVRTSKGVMSGQQAWKRGLGGEILLSVF